MRVSIMGGQQPEHAVAEVRSHELQTPRPPSFTADEGASGVRRASVSTAPLRLALHGLAAEEVSVLDAILRVLNERAPQPWTLVDGDADLLLITRAAVAGGTRTGCGLTALLLREDELPPSPGQLALQSPLRVMGVLDLLHAAHDRLKQMPPQGVASPEHESIDANDGRTLAAALARLIERHPEHALRIRIVGHGTLYLCLKARIYHCDFPRERLAEALGEHRFVMTMLPSTAAELVVLLDSARPVDEALWLIGLVTSTETSFSEATAYRLTRWPDFARFSHRPEHLKACAVMARTHRSIESIVALGGLRRADVEHLLHACALCGYLDTAPGAAVSVPAAIESRGGSPLGGLFDRLRRRFGL